MFSRAPCAVSVKTRLGLSDPEEFGPLLEIYNHYPLAELIVHPRVQKDGYRHPVRLEAFAPILAASRHPVCFNGGLVTTQDCRDLVGRFSGICGVMIGQGLVANPALVRQIRGGPGADRETLRAFHEALFGGYSRARADWQLGEAAYRAAEKAVRDARGERYPSIRAFGAFWAEALQTDAEENNAG